jgi:hypothetical protein
MRVFVVAAALSALLGTAALAQQAPTPSQVQTSGGRYQIIFSPRTERATFMLDTQTGRVWQVINYSYLTGDPTVWVLMDQVNTPADEDKLDAKYPRKPPATAAKP